MGTKMKGLLKGLRYITQIFGSQPRSLVALTISLQNKTGCHNVTSVGRKLCPSNNLLAVEMKHVADRFYIAVDEKFQYNWTISFLRNSNTIANLCSDEEKEPEMQIGNPTDVKHVAHIGWDGQSSADSPSWVILFFPNIPFCDTKSGN